jgi:two-component system, chemotaxis family, chemotaxis protein CheY
VVYFGCPPRGIAAIQGIRLIDPYAKIIVCSATSDPVYVAAAAKLGVSAYLQKPVDPDRLLVSLKKALAEAPV